MEIERSGSQPSGKGPADWFTGTVRIDPLFPGAGAGARGGQQRYLRVRSAHRLAYASARPDADRNRRLWTCAALGRSDRGDPAGRRRLLRAGRETLAWRRTHPGHDAPRHPGATRRQGRRVDGESIRRAIPGLTHRERKDRSPRRLLVLTRDQGAAPPRRILSVESALAPRASDP